MVSKKSGVFNIVTGQGVVAVVAGLMLGVLVSTFRPFRLKRNFQNVTQQLFVSNSGDPLEVVDPCLRPRSLHCLIVV